MTPCVYILVKTKNKKETTTQKTAAVKQHRLCDTPLTCLCLTDEEKKKSLVFCMVSVKCVSNVKTPVDWTRTNQESKVVLCSTRETSVQEATLDVLAKNTVWMLLIPVIRVCWAVKRCADSVHIWTQTKQRLHSFSLLPSVKPQKGDVDLKMASCSAEAEIYNNN